ncbi:MAG: flavin reductase family protein [Thermomicrobiales bacterium]
MSERFRTFDLANPGERETYFLLTGMVIPRPVAWISTLAPDGTANIAPFSFTTILSSDPPVVCFVSSGIKDSMRNAQETGDFVYNVGGEDLLEELNLTAADLHRHESEFAWVNLTPMASDVVKSPRLGEAPISMECKLVDVIPFGGGDGNLVAGEVVRIHIAERIITNDRVDPEKLRPICRLSGSNFATLGDIITLKRPNRQDLIDRGMQPAVSGVLDPESGDELK